MNHLHHLHELRRICLAVVVVCLSAAGVKSHCLADDSIRFSRDILPLLSENCFFCHGPDEENREAELRLDDRQAAAAVLNADHPEDSEFLRRIFSADPDEMMPPPDSNRRLSTEQKELLRRWVQQGAEWERHWSFEPLTAPEVPDPAFSDVPVRNEIDLFVQQKLKENDLRPSAEASRATLLRRVTLDLTGLPPTPAQVRAFEQDESEDAYEQVVERLLKSPAFGERMAWDWLDAARYADSNGYQGDRERTMWPWRDWVVDAFNRNMPYDQFSTYQLAGDLLPGATFEQRLATGFCRNHMINGEGGRIPEENRVDYVMDMTETMGTVWLGLTLNCCRCHDHKYDPLTQRDYYRFFAFFNQTPVTGAGGDPQTPPNLAVPSPSQRAELRAVADRRQQILKAKSERETAVLRQQAEHEQRLIQELANSGWQPVRPQSVSAVHQELTVLDDLSVLASGPNPQNDTYVISARVSSPKIGAIRLEALRHPSMTGAGIARSNSGNFVLTEIEFSIVSGGQRRRLQPARAEATFEQGGYPVAAAFDGQPSTGWAVYQGRPIDRDHAAVFVLKEPADIAADDVLEITLRHDSVHAHHNLGRFRLSVSASVESGVADETNTALLAALQVSPVQRTDKQQQVIREAVLKMDSQIRKMTSELQKLKERETALNKQLPRVMIMQDMPNRRITNVLNRGLYNSPTSTVVHAGLPQSLPGTKTLPEHAHRLHLARWLFSVENPLTARVTVNRFWQQVFGMGLVKTVEDFGVQGEYPQHRELLDWLAADFRDHGWDVKRLIRTMVTSHTYRQTSALPVDRRQRARLLQIDPQNRLYARAPRYRMPSWMLRDSTLAASGLLNREIGGPPVNTYQPAGVWEEATFGKKKHVPDKGDRLYRRSLYIFWRRIVAPTVFFDNASRQTCTVKVLRTNTPLHSLQTLNETTFVESARHLAQTLLLDGELSTDADRVDRAFLRIMGRRVTGPELDIALSGLNRSRSEYRADRESAERMLQVGDSVRDDSIDAAEHAAWASLCLMLLNTDEALTRE